MATKTLNARLQLKHATAAQWATSVLVLLDGEFAFESDTGKFKIGDGSKVYADLPYAAMTPDEVTAALNTSAVQSVSLEGGTNNGTLKLTVDGAATDNIAVTGLGSAAFTESSAYATAAQGSLAVAAVRSVTQGSTNGTVAVVTGEGAETDVAVKGLKSAAYTDATDYATAAQGAKADTAVQAVSISGGAENGTVKLTVDGADTEIGVTGLGSAAFTETSAYATAAQGAKADSAVQPDANTVFTGTVTLAGAPTTDNMAATKKFVEDEIASSISASDAMVFRGTLGTGGTAATLPSGNDVVQGDTYKVISDITVDAAASYTGSTADAKIGDLVVAMASGAEAKWLVVPSGDEIVTTVAVSDTPNVSTTAQSGTVTIGEAATHKSAATIADSSTSTDLPTAAAVASFVEGKQYVTTDENVKNTPNAAKKIYITGTDTVTENTGTQYFDPGVYVDTTAGKLVATTFAGALDGNAATATALETARTIALSGGVTGTATSFDGTGNITIPVTSVSTDYITNGADAVVWDCGGSV